MVKFQFYKTFYQYIIYLKSKSIFQKFIIKIKFLTKKMIKNLKKFGISYRNYFNFKLLSLIHNLIFIFKQTIIKMRNK